MRWVAVVAGLLGFLVVPALAAKEPSEPPHPRPNPSADAEAGNAAGADGIGENATGPERILKPEPSPLDEAVPEPEPLPFGEEVPPEPAEAAALAACEVELTRLGGTFERLPMIDGEGTCGMAAPYRLDSVGRDVRLEPATQFTCETALAFARWVSKVVVPATDALGDDVRLTRVRHGSTYVCRNRNSQSSGKMSGHAFGRAIDVVAFAFEGRGPIAAKVLARLDRVGATGTRSPVPRYRRANVYQEALDMRPGTKTRLGIAALVYMATNAVLFGSGLILVLVLAPAGANLFAWIAGVVVASFVLAAPISWAIAPRLRARDWQRQESAGVHSSPAG